MVDRLHVKRTVFVVLAAWLLVLGALNAPARAESADKVVIGVPAWPSARATSHILGRVLTDQFDLEVELRRTGTLRIFAGIDDGTIDIHPEIWLPNLTALVDKYATDRGSLTLSPQGVTASQNLCVTRATAEAVGISSVADLSKPEIAARFDTNGDGTGEMWIGASTWSSTLIERIRARSYGYAETMTLLEMEEDVAMAGVDVAAATGTPIVFYCYAPHHLFELHDIVVLDEPDHDPATWSIVLPTEDDTGWLERSKAASAWDESGFRIGYGTGLAETRPEVAKFLNAVTLSADDITAMSYALEVLRQDPEDFAAEWIERNDNRVKEWLP